LKAYGKEKKGRINGKCTKKKENGENKRGTGRREKRIKLGGRNQFP